VGLFQQGMEQQKQRPGGELKENTFSIIFIKFLQI